MNIIKPSHRIVRHTEDMVGAVAEAARTCYLSEPLITISLKEQWRESNRDKNKSQSFDDYVEEKFIKKLIMMGHQTPFEFADIEIEFICDRGVSHELVRHRMASPMQESTRYCKYNKDGKHGMNVIDPFFFDKEEVKSLVADINGVEQHLNAFDIWLDCMEHARWGYNALLEIGRSPQEARSVLPNSLKTKLKIKANVREWWHIFNMRALNSGAHPQSRELMMPALEECIERWEPLFVHLVEQKNKKISLFLKN